MIKLKSIAESDNEFLEGMRYFKGNGVEQSYDKAYNHFNMSFDNGNYKAGVMLGELYRTVDCNMKIYDTANKLFRVGMNRSYGPAYFYMGKSFELGLGVKRSHTKALACYIIANEYGFKDGLFDIATFFHLGIGTKRSDKKAFDFYKAAEMNGDARALTMLGLMYKEGDGLEQSYEKAIECFNESVKRCESNAMLILGMMHENGEYYSKSTDDARAYYILAAENGNQLAQKFLLDLSGNLTRKKDYDLISDIIENCAFSNDETPLHANEKSKSTYADLDNIIEDVFSYYESEQHNSGKQDLFFNNFENESKTSENAQAVKQSVRGIMRASANDVPSAQSALALMYLNGYGVEQSVRLAMEHSYYSALGGDSDGIYELAMIYENFDILPENKDYILELYNSSADMGNPDSMARLGYLYENNKYVGVSKEKAIEWYVKAADKGNTSAMTNLAKLYLEDANMENSEEKSFELIKKAAEQYDPHALWMLSCYYRDGVYVKQSDETANHYCIEAYNYGDPDAIQMIRRNPAIINRKSTNPKCGFNAELKSDNSKNTPYMKPSMPINTIVACFSNGQPKKFKKFNI